MPSLFDLCDLFESLACSLSLVRAFQFHEMQCYFDDHGRDLCPEVQQGQNLSLSAS